MNTRTLLLRHARNDLIRNRGARTALLGVLVLSAFLMATGALVVERLVGSIDQLFAQAQPPHFLQMHSGPYDTAALAEFAAQHPEIEAWQIEELLGFDGAVITWSRPGSELTGDFSDSLIDNLFVRQNPEFDFLLDEVGAIAQPRPGEVLVPVAYQQRYGLAAGDELTVHADAGPVSLRIQGFVRDAQMASSLSSATRFVVAEPDFAALERGGGSAPEIIVAYRLSDPSTVGELQRAYEVEESLPKNGQAVTHQIIRLINAFSDGLVAVTLMFVSAMLIAIALVTVRFMIRGTLTDQVREIGALKAIGIPQATVVRLYLATYGVVAALGCAIGGVVAIPATALLTRGVAVHYAQASIGVASVVVWISALLVVFGIVLAICYSVLRAIDRIEVVGALVHGSTLSERSRARQSRRVARRVRRFGLAGVRGSIGGRLAMLDVRAEAGQWVLLPVVCALAMVLMTLPTSLYSTLTGPQFATNLGAIDSDVRADVLFARDVDAVRADLVAAMSDDPRLSDVHVFAHVAYEAAGPDGWETLRAQVGDWSGPGVQYSDGTAPGPGEIALSALNAELFGVTVGDQLMLRDGGSSRPVVVSGVYQDVSSGGLTAQLSGDVAAGDDAQGNVVHASVVDGHDPALIAAEYAQGHPSAKVVAMADYVQQTLSYLTSALRTAAGLAFVFGVGVTLLVTSAFVSLRMARERRAMGILSAIGFSTREIRVQLVAKTLLVVALGVLAGGLLAALTGEPLVSGLIAATGLGITQLDLVANPWLAYLVLPAVLLVAGAAAAFGVTRRLRGADTSVWLG